jgi:hypothetical protein
MGVGSSGVTERAGIGACSVDGACMGVVGLSRGAGD